MKISIDDTGKIIWNLYFNNNITIAVEYKSINEARIAFKKLVVDIEGIISVLEVTK